MEGQELRRTKARTRTQRRRREDASARLRFAWHGVGAAMALTFMTHFDLWNPMAVLAALGGVEVATRAWRAIWSWTGA